MTLKELEKRIEALEKKVDLLLSEPDKSPWHRHVSLETRIEKLEGGGE